MVGRFVRCFALLFLDVAETRAAGELKQELHCVMAVEIVVLSRVGRFFLQSPHVIRFCWQATMKFWSYSLQDWFFEVGHFLALLQGGKHILLLLMGRSTILDRSRISPFDMTRMYPELDQG